MLFWNLDCGSLVTELQKQDINSIRVLRLDEGKYPEIELYNIPTISYQNKLL